MSETRACANGHQWAVVGNSGAPAGSAEACPACGAMGEIVTPDLHAGLTAVDGELPPPPCPLPGAVAQVAAGLLLEPERAGRAGLPTVAGYEILAPLGRGGMGLVYQARQLRFGRVVALKMIRGGAHAEPRDLARFRTEAAAVARLEHPNIVPIYEVGEQDGWAYFALEFVTGGSLARHLAGRPQPAGPSAHLAETLARAMDYAHAQGIVHRDLKPANILLQKSENRNPKSEEDSQVSDFGFRISDFCKRISDFSPKVTDFGLAKRLEPEPRNSNAGERTATGEILGTPSYMAPEQTWGRPGEVGPAADVYALGAILYECLTGRPPFQATTPLDTLLQVRTEEPVPPRRLVPAVPRHLETICLKCLQKEPRRRYASAGALAEDLRRFLDGAPVWARPVRAWERTVRWARRRRAVAALAACSGAAVLGLVVLGVWHYVQLQGHNADLRTERNTADRLRDLAQSREAEARHQKDEAERQWQRAEANFKNALDAVVQMLARVSEDENGLAHEPRMQGVRQKLQEDALRFCQDLLKQKGTDRLTRRESASIYFHIGDFQKSLGRQGAAEAAYRAAIELYQTLVGEFPGRPTYRFELAGCYTNLGNLLVDSPRRKEAEEAYHRALEVQEVLVRDYPDEADYRSDLAGNQHNLGTFMFENGQLREAEQALRQALDHRRRLAEQHPQNAAYRQDVARTQNNLGMMLLSADRDGEAEEAFRQALDLQRRLAEDFPHVPAYRQELAGSHNCLAGVLIDGNQLPEAETEYGHALALQQRLAQDFPRVPAYRRDLASSHHNLALLLETMKRLPEAEQAHRRALGLFRRLVDEFPEVPSYQSALGDNLAHLARVLCNRGRSADARRDAEEGLAHQLTALKLMPGHPRFTYSLAGNYTILAETLVRLGDHEAAAKAAAELPRHRPKKGAAYYQAAAFLARCVPLAEQDPMLPSDKRKARAEVYGDQAIALLRQGLRHPPGPSADQLRDNPHFTPLQARADFRQLVRELEEAAGSAAR